jgi:membrane-associated protease RseP (regulator of RpoE activity)
MKKWILMILVVSVVMSIAFAQTSDEVKKQIKKQITVDLNGDLDELPNATKMMLNINTDMPKGLEAADAPYMGIFVEDLNFPKAQELGYKGLIGVLITGVVSDSPAWNYRLQEDDILVSMDGKEVTNNAVFDKMRKLYRAGDKVTLELYRSGEIIKVDFTFGSRQQKTPSTEGEKPTKTKKLSPGYGGGSWMPLWFSLNMDDVNYLMGEMGFGKLNEDGILMQGGGGKGHVGKGFFIGGAGYSYTTNDKVPSDATGVYHTNMHYANSFGGVTLDKRIPITKGLVTSVGFLLGGGEQSLEVMKNNSNYNWNDWDGTFLNSNNTHSTISRSYILVQPKAEVLVRLLSWMGIRGEAGYVYGYAPSSGWKVQGMDGETIDVKNSPDTEYQGLSFSVGPWFGF